ncbi:hypothetical protein HDU96_002160 [Phlyctochytrium bullatum]|nr:hypothetical protein HDU96_002160 [Phlyctochytrium bullatum]
MPGASMAGTPPPPQGGPPMHHHLPLPTRRRPTVPAAAPAPPTPGFGVSARSFYAGTSSTSATAQGQAKPASPSRIDLPVVSAAQAGAPAIALAAEPGCETGGGDGEVRL